MKTYKGRYKVKNTKKYKGDYENVIFRSLWERNCFRWCDENPKVQSWSSEEVVVPYFYEVDKRYHRYFLDLKITFKEGKTILVEIKPDSQTKPPRKGSRRTKTFINGGATYVRNMNKWDAAMSLQKTMGMSFKSGQKKL